MCLQRSRSVGADGCRGCRNRCHRPGTKTPAACAVDFDNTTGEKQLALIRHRDALPWQLVPHTSDRTAPPWAKVVKLASSFHVLSPAICFFQSPPIMLAG